VTVGMFFSSFYAQFWSCKSTQKNPLSNKKILRSEKFSLQNADNAIYMVKNKFFFSAIEKKFVHLQNQISVLGIEILNIF
jgi:hypothetical protein